MCQTITIRKTKQATIERRITIGEPVNGIVAATVVEITNGLKIDVDNYFLQRQASDFGQAYTVEKYNAGTEATYDVCLFIPGHGHSCDCKWGSYKSHVKPCRHIELILQARRENKI